MKPLTQDDLIPLEEYVGRRREFFESHRRYLDHYRRVRLGPRLTLLFENRQTLWFRVQELLRIARLSDAVLVRAELDLHNRLLPGRNVLQASLQIEVTDETRLSEQLAAWQDLRGDELALHVGSARFPARLLTARPEDRCIGAAHWVQVPLEAEGRTLLANRRLTAHF